MAVECGFELLGVEDDFIEDVREELGFDYMSLIKGGAGMLQGAGGLMSGGGGSTPAAADAEKKRLEAEKAAAESSARTWKILGGILLAVLGLGGVVLLLRKPAVS